MFLGKLFSNSNTKSDSSSSQQVKTVDEQQSDDGLYSLSDIKNMMVERVVQLYYDDRLEDEDLKSFCAAVASDILPRPTQKEKVLKSEPPKTSGSKSKSHNNSAIYEKDLPVSVAQKKKGNVSSQGHNLDVSGSVALNETEDLELSPSEFEYKPRSSYEVNQNSLGGNIQNDRSVKNIETNFLGKDSPDLQPPAASSVSNNSKHHFYSPSVPDNYIRRKPMPPQEELEGSHQQRVTKASDIGQDDTDFDVSEMSSKESMFNDFQNRISEIMETPAQRAYRALMLEKQAMQNKRDENFLSQSRKLTSQEVATVQRDISKPVGSVAKDLHFEPMKPVKNQVNISSNKMPPVSSQPETGGRFFKDDETPFYPAKQESMARSSEGEGSLSAKTQRSQEKSIGHSSKIQDDSPRNGRFIQPFQMGQLNRSMHMTNTARAIELDSLPPTGYQIAVRQSSDNIDYNKAPSNIKKVTGQPVGSDKIADVDLADPFASSRNISFSIDESQRGKPLSKPLAPLNVDKRMPYLRHLPTKDGSQSTLSNMGNSSKQSSSDGSNHWQVGKFDHFDKGLVKGQKPLDFED